MNNDKKKYTPPTIIFEEDLEVKAGSPSPLPKDALDPLNLFPED